ncbi:Uma2 family endonuclease [Streptomyces klenkii]|uniref:Uma2 family endonuclease n=1 Tax=Streptomyces klenkii TaxID=1420899 RepID=A0A3B0BE56_9ACTN|nr:Uma2 family endonuclease [Streptomyces klenkii]RKN70912.1 Uma2 family endonuclease [Streptomyces klenkii]
MTPTSAHRPQMLVEDFERIASSAPETVTLELINGKLEVKPVPDGDHGEIYMWLLEQCMQQRPDLRLYPDRGLKTEGYRQGRSRPDGALAPRRHFTGYGEWADPAAVLMTVEITSYDSDTDLRDRKEKRDGYAAADIPVYLLVDRNESTVVVYSEPRGGKYRIHRSYPYGDVIKIPAPVGVTLETEELKDFAN